MAEPYTPTTDEIVLGKTHLGDNFWRELTENEIRRGLAAHDREVAAKALRAAADEFMARLPDDTGNGRPYNAYTVARMLRARADQIENGGGHD